MDGEQGRPKVERLTQEEYEAHGLEVVRWADPPILRCETCGEGWSGWDWRCPSGCNTDADTSRPETEDG